MVEVKRPEVPLSDPELNRQALRYAEYLRAKLGVNLYAVHNMRYLKLFKYTAGRQPTILDFFEDRAQQWVPVSDFPFKIMPWVSSLREYRQISTNNEARRNVERFLLSLRGILEGRTLDLSNEVVETIRGLIEEGANNRALAELTDLYRNSEEIRKIVEVWRGERGIEKPQNDNELKSQLQLLLKEQLYTFSMRVLFYLLLLQSIDAEMAGRLKETVRLLEEVWDAETFKRVTDVLFKYGEPSMSFKTLHVYKFFHFFQCLQPSQPGLPLASAYL